MIIILAFHIQYPRIITASGSLKTNQGSVKMYLGDSVRIDRAVNLTNRITFTKEHVDSMMWYIDNFEFPEDDEEGTADYLIQQLGYVKHPNIVRVYKHGVAESEKIPYIAMEYVNGKTLTDFLEKNENALIHERLNIICDVAHALEAVHDHDIYHRDIKPGNITVYILYILRFI